jgi:hypothetical protein
MEIMTDKLPQDMTDIIMEKLSIFKSEHSLDEVNKSFIDKLDEDNSPIDHIKFIIKSPFNSYDVFNRPDAPRDEFLNSSDDTELKSLNERFIKLKNELSVYSDTLREKYNNDPELLDNNDSDESVIFIDKFGQKCYELRRDQSLHTIKILYNFIKNNNIDIN